MPKYIISNFLKIDQATHSGGWNQLAIIKGKGRDALALKPPRFSSLEFFMVSGSVSYWKKYSVRKHLLVVKYLNLKSFDFFLRTKKGLSDDSAFALIVRTNNDYVSICYI